MTLGSATATPVWVRRMPDVLTMSRFFLVAVMLASSFQGDRALYVVAILLAVLTDMYDGAIARATGIESKWGANLDSASDLAFYLAIAVLSYLWAPDVIGPLLWLVGVFLVGYVTNLLLSKRYRGVLGFHNRWSRFAATTGVVAGLWLVVFEGTAWLPITVLILATAGDLAVRYRNIYRAAKAARGAGATPATPRE